jgi:hypothetical protein
MNAEKDDMILSQAHQHGDEMHLDLWYPRNETSPVKSLVIGLMDVRAADNIRVSYDFDRDGWRIEQEEIMTDNGHYQSTGVWIEVAFIQAWGNEKQINEIHGDEH